MWNVIFFDNNLHFYKNYCIYYYYYNIGYANGVFPNKLTTPFSIYFNKSPISGSWYKSNLYLLNTLVF